MPDETITTETGYGPVTVSRWQFDLWERYGWPSEDVLRRMAQAQREHGDPNRG